MDTCEFLHIYVKQIEDAGDTFDRVLQGYGFDMEEIDACWWNIADEFEERFGIDASRTHFGNIAADIIFRELQRILEMHGIESDYYVNGVLDTSFHIVGYIDEEVQ